MKTEELPSQIITIGGQKLPIKMRDGSTSEVLVGLVEIANIGDYLSNIGDVNRVCEICTGNPIGWSKTVDDESIYEIDEIARKLNDPRVGRWLKRQQAAMSEMMPLAQQAAKANASMKLSLTSAPSASPGKA